MLKSALLLQLFLHLCAGLRGDLHIFIAVRQLLVAAAAPALAVVASSESLDQLQLMWLQAGGMGVPLDEGRQRPSTTRGLRV